MIEVGITGGIGSGKSMVANIIEKMGYPIFNADEESKHILTSNLNIKNELMKKFGNSILTNNELDRKKIASKVFNNPEALKFLNSILHPKVANTYKEWKEKLNSKICFKEAAILIESGSYHELDKIILIIAPEKVRIKRVMDRDKITEEEVLSRIKNQLSDEEKLKYADFIIQNDEHHALLPQVNLILNQLMKSC